MKKIVVKPICLLAAFILAFCSLCISAPAAKADGEQADFTQYLPVPTGTSWYFDRPQGLATDKYGNIYVAETHDYRIHKMNSNGETIVRWGTLGNGDGQFDYVSDIDIDQNGLVYVLDSFIGDIPGDGPSTTGSRVQVFDSNGSFIRKWTFAASANGETYRCEALALDSDGNVYVTGAANVYKFDNDGNQIKQWGGLGTADGQFEGSYGIAVDKGGYVYVADGNGRIQKFDREGNFIMKWGSRGRGNGQFDLVWGVAVDNLGYVYVTDTERGTIQKFNTNGKFIKKWGHIGNPKMFETYAIAADDFGNIYAGDNLSIFKFSNSGTYLARWGSVSDSNSMFFYATGVAVDSQDNLYVLDRNNYRVQKFNENGNYITKWSTKRTGDRGGTFPVSIAIDSRDNVYITNTGYQRIDVYSSSGQFIKTQALEDCGYFDFQGTGGMAFDDNDNLYIANYWQVQVYDSNIQYVRSLVGCAETGEGNAFGPADVAFGTDGLLYMTDPGSARVIVYDKEGNYIRQWSTGEGDDIYPTGIDVDSYGNVFVANSGRNQIVEFDADGQEVARWGQKGCETTNQFDWPDGIAIDSSNNIYVSDEANSRVMRKPADGEPLPNIEYVSLENTSPILGFAPGGSNHMPIEVSVTSEHEAELSAYVFNSKGKWVARIGVTITESGEYSFDWDGRATEGNTAGLTVGKLAPSSSGGTNYTIRAQVQNENGSDWSTIQTLKFYSSSSVKWVSLLSPRITAGQTATFTYKIEHYSNVEVQILDSKNRIAAKYHINDVFPNRNISTSWDGKATKGNSMSLSIGSTVPAGIYTVQIIAGTTSYKSSMKITVY